MQYILVESQIEPPNEGGREKKPWKLFWISQWLSSTWNKSDGIAEMQFWVFLNSMHIFIQADNTVVVVCVISQGTECSPPNNPRGINLLN